MVHDAFEITVCVDGSNTESFTPMQIIASASPLGAEMTTRFDAAAEVAGRLLARGEEAGRLDHDVDAVVAPRDLGRVHHLELVTSLPSTEKPSSLALTSLVRACRPRSRA